ncbi:MAG TPA: methylenetetrahydrofolate reductase [Actinomycetota bacterium]|jgi:5,10-methylenetetrahydrofolate reductase|nr:methylenetetrahydrofolate reductase [Actinomycetota bacterium]
MTLRAGSGLERVLHEDGFAVTAEVVPPRSADPALVRAQARALVGYADAANVTDSPAASAHMSPVAGSALVAAEGVEPTLQLACRDRNRLAITGDLLGAWALGARNVLCLTGDRITGGEAVEVHDLSVIDLVRFAVRLREERTSPVEETLDPAPGYFVGVADLPLARPYDVGRLEEKADAGADFVQTQIVYDVDALGEWTERLRPLGLFERMFVLVGVAPPRSAASARFMRSHLSGVIVPDAVIARLEGSDDPAEEGVALTVEVVKRLREIDGVAGVHVMGLGREEAVRRVIDRSGLLPRPG